MEARIRKRLLKLVEEKRGDIIEFLQKLVRMASLLGKEGDIQTLIEKKLQDMGLMVDSWEPDLEELKRDPWFMSYPDLDQIGYARRPVVVGIAKGSGNGKSLMLQGHVDVVPLGKKPWTYDPWGGVIKGNRLYGRGSSDMKAGVAAMIMALECLQTARFRPKGDVLIESVIDEETGGNGALACALRGYKADAAIITEPTECRIAAACEGLFWVRVKIEGRAAHSGARHEGVCAIEKGMKIYQTIRDIEIYREQKASHPAFDRNEYPYLVPITIGIFNAGVYKSIVADEARLECRVGFLPGESPEKVYQEFCDKVRETSMTDSWLRTHLPEVERDGIGLGASEIPINHPIIESLGSCMRALSGKKPVITGLTFGTDQRILIGRAETPCVVFGPGSIKTAHSTDEFLEPIEDLIIATKILALTIADWCGIESI